LRIVHSKSLVFFVLLETSCAECNIYVSKNYYFYCTSWQSRFMVSKL